MVSKQRMLNVIPEKLNPVVQILIKYYYWFYCEIFTRSSHIIYAEI
jgi:hypothetical protein